MNENILIADDDFDAKQFDLLLLRAQLALLRMAKCDDVQGYLMSKPLAAVEFAEWAGRTPRQL